MEYLLFHLYAPMQSWGDVAVGGVRLTLRHPTKSAIVGLISAALGYDRIEDENDIIKLSKNIKIAVCHIDDGEICTDYHTTQVPPGKKSYITRRQELSQDKLETILSSREYIQDALFAVAIAADPQLITEVCDALKYPKKVLYLGRKSCPLSLPLCPVIINENLLSESIGKLVLPESLMQKEVRPFKKISDFKNKEKNLLPIFWEYGFSTNLKSEQIVTRRDEILSRQSWRFDIRSEYVGFIDVSYKD